MRRRRETPHLTTDLSLTPEQRDFLSRRTRPFLDEVGIDRPLSFLLQEVYLQGLNDAVQAMTMKYEDAA